MVEIEANIYDQEEVHRNCKVTIWSNSITGKQSIGWEPEPPGPRCFRCGAPVLWQCDFSYEDYGIDDREGIVTTMACSECDASYEVWFPFEEDETK